MGQVAGVVGFEPTGVLPPLVFKTSAFVRSAIPPPAHYTTPGFSWEILGSGSSSEGKELLREPLWVVVGGVYDRGCGQPRRGWVLLADAAVEYDDFLVFGYLAAVAQFGEGGEGCSGLGAHVPCAEASRDQLHPGDGAFVHRDRGAARLPQRLEDEEVAHGGWDPDACGAGLGVLERPCEALAGLEGADDGGAAFGLRGDHAWPLGAYETHSFELREGLPHADEAGATSGRVDDDIGETPAELLGQLEAHRLLALDAVGLFERTHVECAECFGEGGGDAAAVTDQAVHEHEAGAHSERLVAGGWRRVGWDDDRDPDPGSRAVGCQSARRVPGRGRYEGGRAELGVPGDRRRHTARLERAGRIQTFRLGVEARHPEGLPQPRLRQERRISLT